MNLNLFLLIASAVCFFLEVINVQHVKWLALGALFFVLSLIFK